MNYLHASLLVLRDLYSYACGERPPLVISAEARSPKPVRAPALADPVPVRAFILPPVPIPLLSAPIATESRPRERAVDPVATTNFHESYVNVVSACVYKRPVVAFDECSFVVSYATALMVDRHEGRFSHVSHDGQSGWILKDEVTHVRSDIFPVCTPLTIYDAYHGTTIAIRRLILDQFRAGELFLPLQSVEYVTYRLLQNGRTIPWTPERPREPGTWHRILRGVRGIHTDITPHTGAIMEWYEGGEGCVAYTERVRPNGTVVISQLATVPEGQFMESEMTLEDCREKGVLWIQIS